MPGKFTNVIDPVVPWPLHRFAVLLTWDLNDPLNRPILCLLRPGEDTVWREFPHGVTVQEDTPLEVFEAVYAALESTQEVILEEVGRWEAEGGRD